MAFAVFIDAALDGGTAPLFADGHHVRHFTYVGDVVDATARAAAVGTAGAVLNVAGVAPASLASALGLIEGLLGAPVRVRRQAAFDDEAIRTHADTSAALRTLGWRPSVGLEQGLRSQIAEARARREPAAAAVPAQRAARRALARSWADA
jgi:UDP-glucose 4-epimerase